MKQKKKLTSTAKNSVEDDHTFTANITNGTGSPQPGVDVFFTILSGPNADFNGTNTTNENGNATFTYSGSNSGTDTIRACYEEDSKDLVCSKTVTKV